MARHSSKAPKQVVVDSTKEKIVLSISVTNLVLNLIILIKLLI